MVKKFTTDFICANCLYRDARVISPDVFLVCMRKPKLMDVYTTACPSFKDRKRYREFSVTIKLKTYEPKNERKNSV